MNNAETGFNPEAAESNIKKLIEETDRESQELSAKFLSDSNHVLVIREAMKQNKLDLPLDIQQSLDAHIGGNL